MSTNDIEKGQFPSSTVRASQHSTSTATTSDLEVFRILIGIKDIDDEPAPKHADDQRRSLTRRIFPTKIVTNKGLYRRAWSQEWQNRVLYTCSNYIISGLYLLQILLAATFTALAAHQDMHSVSLTVLGAINTVTAGILAWLKGQGMPNRFRKARDQYRELIKEIEMAERTFAEIVRLEVLPGEKRLTPVEEVDRLERLYNVARLDQQANYPDVYVSSPAVNVEEKEKGVERDKDLGELKDKVAMLEGMLRMGKDR